MPGFIHTPKDEARWSRAKEAAGKSTKKDSESYWKLSNYIYHKMGKTEEDARLAQLAYEGLDKSEKLSMQNYSNFVVNGMPEKQSIIGNEVTNMSDEKKYSAREAAAAVLAKAHEILQKSEAAKLAKAEEIPQKSADEKDATPPDAVQEQPAPENNPAEQKEGNNPEWGTAPTVKGHVKLAKFCGSVEAKRKKPAAPGAM